MNRRENRIAVVVHGGVAHAGEAVDKTLAVKADGVVRIENVRGRIEVQGWDRSDVIGQRHARRRDPYVHLRDFGLDDDRKGRNTRQPESRRRLGSGDSRADRRAGCEWIWCRPI